MDQNPRTNAATDYRPLLNDHAEQFLLKLKADRFPGCAYMSAENNRTRLAQVASLAGEPEPVPRVEDLRIPGNPEIPARLYVPDAVQPPPIIVYFHGGGWIGGDYSNIDAPISTTSPKSRIIFSEPAAPAYSFSRPLTGSPIGVSWNEPAPGSAYN